MSVAHYKMIARAFLEEKRVLLAGMPLAGATRHVRTLRGECGVRSCFVIANGVGTGEVLEPDEAEWEIREIRAEGATEELRQTGPALARLDARLQERIDEWDPDGTAIVLGNPFVPLERIGGRRVIGHRRPEWLALEDKVVIDAVWDACDVARAPCRVLAAGDLDGLMQAARELDDGAGTAWAGDARDGFNGGAEYVRWVRSEGDARDAMSFFTRHCDRVRVMPFLDGIPCSIHGFVFPDRTLAFRPCEMVVFRDPERSAIRYAGLATFWDPSQNTRETMRAATRRVGEHLRDAVAYRGAFTIDGVMTRDGFRPTELNTRAGAGLGGILSHATDIPFDILQALVIEAIDLDWQPDLLERTVLEAADANRRGGGWTLVFQERDRTETFDVRRRPDGVLGLVRPDSGRAFGGRIGTLSIGPATTGALVRFTAEPDRTPVGPSIAPLVAEAFRLAAEAWGIPELGVLESAIDHRC